MSFISFNEKYYLEKLNFYENKKLSDEELIEIKRILKVLDDLEDEGYTTLSSHLESKFRCKFRLKSILTKYGEKPFPVQKRNMAVAYENKDVEAVEFFDELIASKRRCPDYKNDFLKEAVAYFEWIKYDEDTAYIFLLRDAFLQYVYFKNGKRANLYPWLIGRAFLDQMANSEHVDDEFRLPIYDALENEIIEFPSFCAYCKERILEALKKYPRLKSALLELLKSVPEQKICVIESGYCGTIPMLLFALDERIDFRLYTTAPFLYKTYSDKIFCRKYENIRKFETLFSNDALFRYSRFDEKFYINVTADKNIRQRALGEIYFMTL